ncbi:MAG: polysaccharide deacetylase family protein [Clostridiales bacterium]
MRYRKLKIIISLFFWILMRLKRFVLHCFGKKEAGKCVAVYYHSVLDHEKKEFKKQMHYLVQLAEPLQAGAKMDLKAEKNYVIITFDDGFQSFLRNALPVLQDLKIPCAVFFPTLFIGMSPDWEEWNIFKETNEVIMTEEQIKSLPKDLITIGSHSHSHPAFFNSSDWDVDLEFCKSKEILKSICATEVTLFSFPYGQLNEKLAELAFEAGYSRLFTIDHSVIDSVLDKNIMGRVFIDPSDSKLEFKLKISGAYKWMQLASFFKKITKSFFESLFPMKKMKLQENLNFDEESKDN